MPRAPVKSEPSVAPPNLDAVAHDHQLRVLLKQFLRRRDTALSTLVLDELELAYGAARADLVVVGDVLEGFEIKAANDTLTRLPRQMQAYDQTFERCWLVTVDKHLGKVKALVPSWWGLLVADAEGALSLVREPRDNPLLDAAHLVRLLWREEALAKLEAVGQLKGFKTKPKLALFAKLADCVSLPELSAYVRGCLRARTNWRDEDGSSMLGKSLRG